MTIIWAGLSLGALYALVAVLFNVILAQTGLFNFAGAQSMMVGGFVAYSGMVDHGLPSGVVVVLGALAGGVVGLLTERLAVRPLLVTRSLREASFSVLVTSLGMSFAIQGAATVIWGSGTQSVPFPGSSSSFHLFGGILQPLDVALFIIAVVLTVGLELATRHTSWGISGRATTEDEQAAGLRGVNVRRVVVGAFVFSGVIGGALGPLAAGVSYANITLGTNLLVYAFVALAIGGYGSYLGCLLGGLITGIIQLEVARYSSSDYALIILLGLVLVILLARPYGLLGVRDARVV